MVVSALRLRPPTTRRTLAVLATALGLSILAIVLQPSDTLSRRPQPERTPTSAAPRTFDAALAQATDHLAGVQTLAAQHPDEWLFQERLANAWLRKARLTGSFADYAGAQAALDQGFAHARPGTGPHLTQATLDFSLHRLARTQAMLDAIGRYALPPDREDADEAAGLSGDIAFYRGNYADAARRYQALGPSSGAVFRQAVLDARMGRTDAALAGLDAVERGLRFPTAQALANLELQRGGFELQRGEWDKARAHFARAERLFPGDWLAQAHSAQMTALAGRRAEAIRSLTAIAQRSGAPEVMDALAAIYRAEGDYPNASAWSGRAGAIWETRLRQIPEAAWGHAVEHYLAFGDPARALDLARRDYAARPYAGAATALAWALVANNQPAEALRVLKPALASSWVSSDLHVAAAQAYLLTGQEDEAAAQRKAAVALNPHALDQDAALIWFGH